MANSVRSGAKALLQPMITDSGAMWYWVVPRCPYCRKAHRHIACSIPDNPFMALGERISACSGEKYWIFYGGLLPFRKLSDPSVPRHAAQYLSNPDEWLRKMRDRLGETIPRATQDSQETTDENRQEPSPARASAQ